MELKIILALTFLLITIFCQTIQVKAISPLHVEGKHIKDEAGCNVYLRGIGSWKFYTDPTGWFQPEGGTWLDGQLEWNEVNVRYHLQTMKDWGFNVFRLHTPADWWIQDQITVGTFSGSYRQIIKDLITWAGDYGIYIMYDHFTPISYQTAPNHASGIPYAPYVYNWEHPEQTYLMEAVFPNKQAFADYWGSVATELKDYPNVIFEIQNEPHALSAVWDLGYGIDEVRNDWFDAVQKSVDAIRATGATQPIVITWGLAVPHDARGWEGTQYDPANIDMSFVDHIGTTDPLNNLIYTGHTYKEYIPWSSDYNTLKAQMQDSKWENAASKVPVLLGEFGVNQWRSGADLADHMLWAENFMNICNEWGIGYIGWNWGVVGGEDQGGGWGIISDEGVIIYGPNPWGQVLIDATAEGGTTVCEGNYPVNITGTVTDSDTALSIQGATVTCNASNSTTDFNGKYLINMPSTGSCSLTASRTGYTTDSISFSFPNNGTYTQDFSLIPSPTTTTTTVPPGYKTISGQLMNTTGTIGANITIYNQGTSIINASDITDSFGSYSLSLWSGIYDLQYNILEFFVSNFWIKLMSLDIVSDLPNVVNYVTGSSGNINFTVNITTDQEIQVYSEEKPKTVKANGIEMTEGILPLSTNEWFYNSFEQRLYMKVSPIVTTTTTISTTTTTTITTTTIPATTTTSTTTTIPGVEKTFGKTDIGANQAALNANDTYGSRFTLPEDGSVTKISIWMVTGTWHQKIKFAIYDVSAGNPNNLMGTSEEILSETGWQWYNATFNPPISLTAGDYYLFVWSTEDWYASQYDTDGTHAYRNINYNGFPDPFGTPDGTGNYNITIYATYTT